MKQVPRTSTRSEATLRINTSVDYLVPFIVWGIDLIGAVPIALRGLKYCVVVIDYFTKWIETEPLVRLGKN